MVVVLADSLRCLMLMLTVKQKSRLNWQTLPKLLIFLCFLWVILSVVQQDLLSTQVPKTAELFKSLLSPTVTCFVFRGIFPSWNSIKNIIVQCVYWLVSVGLTDLQISSASPLSPRKPCCFIFLLHLSVFQPLSQYSPPLPCQKSWTLSPH